MACTPRIAVAVLVSVLVLGCSEDEPDVERSAEAFCARYAELAEQYDADVRTVAPMEQSTPDEVRELADRAPDPDLQDALDEIADIQPEVIEAIEGIQTGTMDPHDVDSDQVTRYGELGRVVHDARHELCD